MSLAQLDFCHICFIPSSDHCWMNTCSLACVHHRPSTGVGSSQRALLGFLFAWFSVKGLTVPALLVSEIHQLPHTCSSSRSPLFLLLSSEKGVRESCGALRSSGLPSCCKECLHRCPWAGNKDLLFLSCHGWWWEQTWSSQFAPTNVESLSCKWARGELGPVFSTWWSEAEFSLYELRLVRKGVWWCLPHLHLE